MCEEQPVNGAKNDRGNMKDVVYLTPEKRIEELEKLLASTRSELDAWRYQHPLTTLIYELRSEVRSVKTHAMAQGPEPQLSLNLTFSNWVSVLFVAIIAAGFYVFLRDHDRDLVFDYLGYVFPLLAGWTAGFGLYTKRAAIPAFLFSIVLLAFGFTAYVRSKHLLPEATWAVVVVAGTSTAIYWALIQRANPTETDKALWPIRWLAAGISLLLLLVFFGLWGRHTLNWPIFNAR